MLHPIKPVGVCLRVQCSLSVEKYQYSKEQRYNTPQLTVYQQGKNVCVSVHFTLQQAQRTH